MPEELNSAHRRSQSLFSQYKPVTLNRLNCSCICNIINISSTQLRQSVWENLDLDRVDKPHCVRSVLTTSVKILPYRPLARLIRAKYFCMLLILLFYYWQYYFHCFQTFIPREQRRDTNKIYKKMTLSEFIKYTGLAASSSNVSIFYIFVFCIISYICKGYFDEKLMAISVLLIEEQRLEELESKGQKTSRNSNSGKEGDSALQGHIQTVSCVQAPFPVVR